MAAAQVHATLALAAAIAVKTSAAEDAWTVAAGASSTARLSESAPPPSPA